MENSCKFNYMFIFFLINYKMSLSSATVGAIIEIMDMDMIIDLTKDYEIEDILIDLTADEDEAKELCLNEQESSSAISMYFFYLKLLFIFHS